MRQRISELDKRLFARMAARRSRPGDAVLPRLSRAANHGRLWMATAAGMAALGGHRSGRAAMRGLGALAIASFTVNTLVKAGVRRQRPTIDEVPLGRRLSRQPRTWSFPSGHAASAAAFATGVALESPRHAAVVAPLAAAVGVSRVHVGVHYPGDVLAGWLLGAGAAVLTLRWWPRRPVVPPEIRHVAAAPALAEGNGLFVVVNAAAGASPVSLPGPGPAERIARLLPGAEVTEVGPADDGGPDLAEALDRAARRAAETGGALGVCGGDGTVNAAAERAAERGVPLAVFPGGTLNHFAGDLAVHTTEETVAAVEEGTAIRVDLALARPLTGATDDGGPRTGRAGNPPEPAEGDDTPRETDGHGADYPFVNTFSIGMYPELVAERERLERRLGKWPAAVISLFRVLRTSEPLDIRINGRPHRVWLLFAGNGRYLPDGFAPVHRQAMDEGLLDVRTIDGDTPLARTRLLGAALLGTMSRSRVYTAARLRRLELSGLEGVGTLARDGETAPAPAALVVEKRPGALVVYRPIG
ncbi:bifunctional phosphatase PAP2/diacylglycerol kinase family protein [Streptomyces calidiresistens]|uniref:Phosphatase PAP2 family protein n=1 Tax=Streptomyces calidiresistens TaxID=1485586 RepID=A0A7W3XXM0_9ACTN|nr:bifunctional phosphatase PAP2/diacylglycerol kinase family protein [Streptomyces calidiresistens]MBB0231053.1 phosphatase PAP2 family protein [Streptomyces calidiresistens]